MTSFRAMTVTKVTDATFEAEVLKAGLPVLIDLYADWCQPCKQLSPIVEQVAKELEGKLKVVKVDVDKSPRVAASFRVQSIPMLTLIHEGKIVDQLEGLVDKRAIEEMVRPVLPAAANEVTPKDLAALLKARRVLPVDVRDPAAYSRYRIPGAVNIPAADLPAKARDLAPRDGRVRVLYGRTTDEAKPLTEALRAQGVEVAYLAGGFLHWEADGLEVEKGPPSAAN